MPKKQEQVSIELGRPNQHHGRRKAGDQELIDLIRAHGVTRAARISGIDVRDLYERRRRLEQRYGIKIDPPTASRTGHVTHLDRHPSALTLGIENGHVLIGSDSHYWPDNVSTAHAAFLEFCKEFKPKIVVKNGDELDFAKISRHAPIMWEHLPDVADEIDWTKQMLNEVVKLTPKARHIWPLGNHDARFETRLATIAPQYANVHGVHLKDNFPDWEPCWAIVEPSKKLMIKHRMRGGIHATRNNTLQAGWTVVTGHLHALNVRAHSDLNGTRWGVDCGTMADPYGPQFNYTELNPMDWRSGFVLLTFQRGKLLWPETVWVSGPGTVQFRGKEWSV